jgi:ferredoxin
MADPDSTLCKNCFRCVVDCPQRALSIKVNDEFKTLGKGVWTPVRVTTMWNEAENGKIPVLGAGYRGNFSGPGFDAMWTDMSEIVRPTRDGIHGREFISTAVDIGRKPSHLVFDEGGRLLTRMGTIIDLPVPFLLDMTRLDMSDEAKKGIAAAAGELGTMVVLPLEDMVKVAGTIAEDRLVPLIEGVKDLPSVPQGVRMLEVEHVPQWSTVIDEVRSRRPDALVAVRTRPSGQLENDLEGLAEKADVIHVLFEESGMDQQGRYARDVLRSVHRKLVRAGTRDMVTIISSGGLAAAEMVPKSIICGADAVTLEMAMHVALGCRACVTCEPQCPSDRRNAPAEYVKQRVTNMCSAWRDQMLEMLGAMGIREVRRLRGETGRAIFEEDALRDAFHDLEGGGKFE